MILLLLHIVQLRLGLIARRRRERQFMRLWQPVLAEAVAGGHADPPPLGSEDLVLFLKMWNHLHESVRGSARKHLNILALRLDILRYLPRLLYGKGRGKKLLAITTLGNLQARDDWKAMVELSRDPDALLSWTAAHALFQIDAHTALRDLEEHLVERVDWPAAHVIVLLKEAGTDEIYDDLASRAVQLAESSGPHELARL